MATPPPRRAGVPIRQSLGTPLVGDAPRLLLLGSGELGREVAIEAMRLGAEVIAVDRYANAPAMQVAHRSHVLPMTDGAGLSALVRREQPDVIVPEIEQIDTDALVALEQEGWTVIPGAEATRTTMDRERIRRLASERAHVATSRFAFAESASETRTAAQELGLPCIVKAMTSSSGHGMTVVRTLEEAGAAYATASQGGRIPRARVMLEELVAFDLEVTVLAVRHYDRAGRVVTTTLDPIAHARPGTLYHESWQPAGLSRNVTDRLSRTATAVTDQLGGFGVFGVECFVRGGDVLFSEVSPRPHDTGLVTLGSQWNSEFALHARAILGLPFEGPEPTTPAAAHVILAAGSGWAPRFGGVRGALSDPAVRVYLFGKPEGYADRRLGVVVARGGSVGEARSSAERAAHAIEAELSYVAPRPESRAHGNVG